MCITLYFVISGGGPAAVGPKEALPTNPATRQGGCGFNMNDRRPPGANYAASQMVRNTRCFSLYASGFVCVCVCVCVGLLICFLA